MIRGESGALYRLSRPPAASGGQALLYRAVAEDDGREVAVKVALRSGEEGAWLLAEARLLGDLALHPTAGAYVVPIWDTGDWEGRPFLVLDWCPDTLASWADGRPLAARLAVVRRLVAAVCALHVAAAEDPRFVHGDITPGNVLVRDDGDVVFLADFGAAAARLHTPGYGPPERSAGATAAGDRYSLAATIWAVLTGGPPTGAWLLELREAVTAADRATFDAAVPEGRGLRLALEALLQPVARRAPDLRGLERALHGEIAPGRGWTRAVVGAGCFLIAGIGIAAVVWREPACPGGWQAEGRVCVGPQGVRMVRVPRGLFRMGRAADDPAYTSDAPAHEVVLSRRFLLDEAEVTQGEWAALVGDDPMGRIMRFDEGVELPCDVHQGVTLRGADRPVVCVTWFEAVAFANQRSRRDGLAPAYTIDGTTVAWDRAADGYRLPTEAEWEYAARAGSGLAYLGTAAREEVCAYANVRDASALEKWGNEVACDDGAAVLGPVRAHLPNAWGLYDLQGNALEWVWDRYGDYGRGPSLDPEGPASGPARVSRGGSWNHVAKVVAARYASVPATFENATGFRLARSLD